MSQTTSAASGCGAPEQTGALPASVDLETETVLSGTLSDAGGKAVEGGYVRLLDARGEFTAEVVTGAEGVFRFFAAPGSWTLRALSREGDASVAVDAERGLNEYDVTVAR